MGQALCKAENIYFANQKNGRLCAVCMLDYPKLKTGVRQMKVKDLAEFRKRYHDGKGITLEELAAKSTLSFSTVYKMEKGKECGRNSVQRVADVLKVKLGDLVQAEV